MQMRGVSITHPDCRGIRPPVRKREATDGIDLDIRGCCGDAAASGHGAFVNGTCHTSYISRFLPNVPSLPIIFSGPCLSRLSRIGGGLGFPLYRRAWKDFSCRERGSGRTICVPSKKSRFQVALWKSYRISSQWLKKEIFWRFCSHRCGSRASSVS